MPRALAPFECRRDGTVAVRLTDVEADAVGRVAAELALVLEQEDGGIDRLYPTAYDDPREQEEFERLTRDDLTAHKLAAARAVKRSIEEGRRKRGSWSGVLDDATAHQWLAMLNDARLVLGTRLQVTEDTEHEPLPPDDPAAPAHNMYLYLSGLQAHLVEALLQDRFPDDG